MKYSLELGVTEDEADRLIRLKVAVIFINAVAAKKSRVKSYN